MIKLVNKIKYILSKLQIKSLKYEFLIIPAILICCAVYVPCEMIPWEHNTREEVKKVKDEVNGKGRLVVTYS